MRKLLLQLVTVCVLFVASTTTLFAQDDEFPIAWIAPKTKVQNPRVCVSTTETQIDKCPTGVQEQSCPSGNCDKNYTACRIFGPKPNDEYEYAYSEVESHEFENPKEVPANNGNGVKVMEDGKAVCHKRKPCKCIDIPGVSATCETKDEVEEVVIQKWRKTADPC